MDIRKWTKSPGKFSLKSLLIAVSIAAAIAAWASYRIKIAAGNSAAMEAIQRLGGEIQYGNPGPYSRFLNDWFGDEYFSNIDRITFEGNRVTDDALCKMLRTHFQSLHEVSHISIDNCPITEKSLIELAAIADVETLSLVETNICDEGILSILLFSNLRHLTLENVNSSNRNLQSYRDDYGWISLNAVTSLTSLPELKSLTLRQFYVNDDNLELLQGFRHLDKIGLFTLGDVSDDGIAQLKGLQCLERVEFSGKEISDASMLIFGTFPNLVELWLDGTSITDAGVAEISNSLPNLQQLRLTRAPVSDACLSHLSKLSRLSVLQLPKKEKPIESVELVRLRQEIWEELYGDIPLPPETGISAAAVKRLRKSSPNLLVQLFDSF